ncbi:MAG: hypothetical protein HEQ38_08495 [Gemmatimonas sp.]|jgi:hypothetical protein|uniref:hypothetical protein n=1 Tax=Gemmatimonas sp. TaxID=1962908 RepID=UPI0031BFC214|nr:hypothetical protein [Gemmatimonas sp.]
MLKTIKGVLQLAALGVGVTIIGLIVGAFLMSPGVSREQRIIAFVALGGAAGLVLLYDVGVRALATFRKGRSRRATLSGVKRPTTAAAPSIKLAGRGGKTPRAVQALAAAGAAPAEIAWKTGLPLDAVSMLLEIGGRH